MFSAKEETLHQVFGEKRYAVPYYQRPYSWQKENAEDLWNDLFNAWREEGINRGGYFLGSVVLVAGKQNGRDDIVDGQQRFLTLQLLLCAISRFIEDDDKKRKLLRYIISEENEFAGTKAELVVEPGRRYVEAYARLIKGEPIETHDEKSLAQFQENLQLFIEKAQLLNQKELVEFALYIIKNAHLAVLKADSEVKALRIFAVLNDRGIDLHPVDILKARLIETTNLSDQLKRQYADKWEQYEEEFERQKFQDLVTHIRMTYVRARTKKPLHEDILSRITKASDAEEFLGKVLPSYAAAFSEMSTSDSVEVQNLVAIGQYSRFKDWEAPLIFILKLKGKLRNYEVIARHLSAIVAMMAITRMPDGQRAGRFGKIIDDIERYASGKIHLDGTSSLAISKLEFNQMKHSLAAADAYSIRGLKAGMLWFESISGDGKRPVGSSEVTIEHILPRTVGTEAWWLDYFDKNSWAANANRLGNLVLATGRTNQKMARKSFADKKDYLASKGGSQWLWTRDAMNRPQWDLNEITSREHRIFKQIASAILFSTNNAS